MTFEAADHNPDLPLWERVRRKLTLGYLVLRYAPVDPIYAYSTLTDVGWGLNVIFGVPYQPSNHSFDMFNAKWFGIMLFTVGLLGVWNFFNRRTWILVFHSAINCLFYLYITAVFFQQNDGAWVRNGTMTLCILWIIWRTQKNGWRMVRPDRFIPKGH